MHDIPHYPFVNWTDGMKINRKIFTASDNAILGSLGNVAGLSLSPSKYGILPSGSNASHSYHVNISMDNQELIRVSVLACRAITPGGFIIDIQSAAGSHVNDTAADHHVATFRFTPAGSEHTWWVAIQVDPFNRKPSGNPDISANPPRIPFTAPAYTIRLVSDQDLPEMLNDPFALLLGKILTNEGNVSVDTGYIPPCYSISSSNALMNIHARIGMGIARMERHCIDIEQKVYKKDPQSATTLVNMVMFLCDRLLLYAGLTIATFRSSVHESPFHLYAPVMNLARTIKNTIDIRTGSGKDELIKYLAGLASQKTGELESTLAEIADLRFDHHDAAPAMKKLLDFTDTWEKMLGTLSTLDFIGKHPEGYTYVVAEVKDNKTQEEPPKPKRRFTD